MPYVERVTRAGKTIEVERYFTSRYKKPGIKRGDKVKPTKEEQKKVNTRAAERKLRLLLNANFGYGDYHLELDYIRKKGQPDRSREQMRKDMDIFLRELRKECKKAGIELKYVHVMEIGKRGARHHHLVINKIDTEILQRCWYKAYEGHNRVKVFPLDDSGNYAKLASYFIKYTDTHRTEADGALQGKASNYDPAQITIACEADCSSGVAAIVKGAGYRLGNEKMKNVSIYLYTGNMRAGLKAAGFEVLTDSKYLTSDAYLLEGDITLNDNAHVAINLTDGAKSSGTGASNTTPVKSNTKVDVAHGFNKSLAGTYKVTASGLNLRAGAGTGKSILAVMKNGEKVQCYGYYNDCNGVKWLYVVYKNIVGYASSKYLSK